MPGTKRQEQKKQTRSRILEAAIEQFAKQGLTTTSTVAIAEAAHVAHGTVFAHFSTQEELLSAAIEEFGKRINQRLHELAGAGGGVREVLAAHLKGLTEHEAFYTRMITEARLLPEEARNTLIMIQSTASFHLSEAVEKEITAGSIQPLPVHLVFNGWVGLVHYYLANSDLFAPGGSVLERYGHELLQYYMTLIKAR